MTETSDFHPKELLDYYENEAEEVPIFGSLREISLAENIMQQIPASFASLIDVGCGEGYLLYRLREKYGKEHLYGLDLSNGRIQATKQNVPNAHLLRGNVLSLPFSDNLFDVVVCSELLEHISEYPQVINELLRISKKHVIITVPNELRLVQLLCPKCKTKHYLDGHVNYFTEQKIRALFEKRDDVSIMSTARFHSIYTYNRLTMKFPLFLRLFFDKYFLKLHKTISFLKPNFLMITLEKKLDGQHKILKFSTGVSEATTSGAEALLVENFSSPKRPTRAK